ncbi:D-lactaldehyde dehydrogenase [Mrakia frigida]|uniref:D-lactaldehyde dehydrogenase n=1 Tax=Mrakia frigida TaxID=29902 RepID=UPI003FCC00A8
MPASQTVPKKGDTILVTGASGFIAVHVVDLLLNEGFKVVGTVRREYLVNLFKGKPFTYKIVKDIAEPHAFDEAVKGVQGIAHTASPFHLKADDPEELIKPAVEGTVGVLKSALKNGEGIQRVVVTSSVASIIEPATPPHTFTEKDWNEFSIKEVAEKGAAADGGHKYRASKVLAEKAAWKFLVDNPEVTWGIATVNPPLVFGPILHQVSSPDALNTSVAIFHGITKGSKTEADLPGSLGNWVDVREVAYAHFKALTLPEAGGERFLTSAGGVNAQDFTDFLNTYAPDLPGIPHGAPGAAEEANLPANVIISSGAKAAKVLGVKYRSIQETSKDMYESLKAKGW